MLLITNWTVNKSPAFCAEAVPSASRRLPWVAAVMAALLGLAFAADELAGPLLVSRPGSAIHGVARTLSHWLDFGPLLAACLLLLAFARAGQRAGLQRLLTAVLLSGLLTGGAGLAVRCVTGRTRPDAVAPQGWYGVRHDGAWLIGVPDFNSFPSGHTVLATSLAAVPLVALRRRGWWAMALPLAAGWSRLSLNRHHLSDVVAGLCFGVLGAWFTWHRILPAAERWLNRRFRRPAHPVGTVATPGALPGLLAEPNPGR